MSCLRWPAGLLSAAGGSHTAASFRTALGNLIGLEEEAATIRTYEPELVPGLLQTPDYARAVIRAGRPGDTAQEIDRRVEVRLERQEVLTRITPPPPKVSVVLNEGVLARRVAPRSCGRSWSI